ncbi:MAG: amino acid adenylation domain-containing protein, partial [Chloroflexi bacterium]|nr:amino acid adenylation domain-containing protein [Chloroflexota bacterium]
MSNQKANVRKEIEAIYPLSSMQEGMLFHALFAPESELYFLQQTADFYGTFNDTVFRQAWQLLAQRHPILRTFFVWEKQKQPIQVVRRRAAIPVETLDWCDLPTDEQTAQWQSLLTEDRAVGFELNKTPIHRVKLVRLGEEQHRLVWSYHHILQDGWTTNLLFRELFQLYDGLFQGETIELASVRPYQTFIRWLGQQDKTADESFWRDYLRGFSAPTPLNVDRKVGQHAHQSTVYDELRFQLTHEMANRLQAFARDHRLTLSNLIQGAWAILLSRYSGAEDVLYGTTFSGRSARLQGIEEIAGVFINTLPIRARVESGTEVVTWLKEFQQNQLVLQQYEHTPLVTVQGWSEVSKDQSLFDSLIVFENYPQSEGLGQESGLRVQRHSTEERTNYPLTVRMLPTAASIHFFFIYDQERFDAATIKRMFAHWQTLLNAILDQPDEPVAQLNMLTPPELDQLLHTWNHSDLQFRPEMCIHQRVAQQAAQTPDKPALTFEAEMLTYRQLNERANQLAHHLQTQGIQPDDLVALYLERSLHTVIAILAVLKAGGAYLPMDTAYPQERLAFMLEDSEASLVLTTADLRLTIEPSLSNLICLDSDWQIIATRPTHNPSSDVQPHNRAYVIYTSGSTGKPKGVLVTHHNVMRLFQATDHWYNFSADDVWTLFHSYAFDFSVWEIWGALLYGGRVVVVPYMTSRSPQDFYNLLCHEGVTVLNQTPSAFRQLIQAEEMVGVDDRLRLRSVIFGGEALELNSLQPWFERHDDERPQLINMYGITETTVHVTYRPITKQDLVRAPGSVIGRQIPDLQIYILDQNQQPVPIGVPGEIYVGGAGVAAGYLNRPELTAERFVQLSVISEKLNTDYQILNTVYRTGDLARRLPDGDIEYLGRIDHQVKIRGFRIELGEIEAALGGHSGVREVLVLARGEGGEKQLVAYFVPNTVDDESLGVSELRNYLQPKLPIYMIPATFVRLQAFPLTTNGKIDRRALPQPDDARLETERPFTPPR